VSLCVMSQTRMQHAGMLDMKDNACAIRKVSVSFCYMLAKGMQLLSCTQRVMRGCVHSCSPC
jgi:hypothetical protein